MSQTQTYEHALTGARGEYSESFAALFPELHLVDATPETVDESVDDAPEPVARTTHRKPKREVA